MLYQWYELSHAAVRPARAAANSYRLFFNNPFNPMSHTAMGRSAAAACEVFERTTRQYGKPEFGITATTPAGAETAVAVEEEVVWQRPFCRLVHFKRDMPDERPGGDPRLLIVAPMSGHYATLMRGTVEALLPGHDVYITDWQNARCVPKTAGRFDLSDYINYMRDMLHFFGGDVHMIAVCQPAVPVLAAVALMEAEDDPDVPASMILMGGPVDTRLSMTSVNKLAERRGTKWFERNVVVNVPWGNPGHGRKVYPGFLQLGGFMTMNLDRHVKAHKDMFFHLVRGDGDSAEKHREFYDEYLAVMDMTAEYYLQTIDAVFVRHLLPRGKMTHLGRPVDLGAIKRVALMTVEGEKDDITGKGQCAAAQNLCANLPDASKTHFTCPGVGHYGIFNGRRFRNEIAPRIGAFVRRHDRRHDRWAGKRDEIAHGRRDMGPVEPDGSASHAKCELEESAFTFSPSHSFALRPANDQAPDAPTQSVDAAGSAGQAAGESVPVSHLFAAQAALMQFWGMAGAMMLSQFVRMNTGPTHRGAQSRPEQRRA